MKYVCIWLLRFYQKFLSPLKRNPCCRFYPTCSAYAVEAYQKRGFFVGTLLTAWRILRCNPVGGKGYDPVPERGLRNTKRKGNRNYGTDNSGERFEFKYNLPAEKKRRVPNKTNQKMS